MRKSTEIRRFVLKNANVSALSRKNKISPKNEFRTKKERPRSHTPHKEKASPNISTPLKESK